MLMNKASPYRKYLWLLISISAFTRLLISAFTELSNDEVYYINYALFPI